MAKFTTDFTIYGAIFFVFFVSFVNALYAHTKRAAFYLDQVWFRIQMKVEQESCVRTMVASTMIEERIKVLLRKKGNLKGILECYAYVVNNKKVQKIK